MPQILYYLKLPETSCKESFNFGTLAIYTCQNSCEAAQKYKKEFLWEQSSIWHYINNEYFYICVIYLQRLFSLP